VSCSCGDTDVFVFWREKMVSLNVLIWASFSLSTLIILLSNTSSPGVKVGYLITLLSYLLNSYITITISLTGLSSLIIWEILLKKPVIAVSSVLCWLSSLARFSLNVLISESSMSTFWTIYAIKNLSWRKLFNITYWSVVQDPRDWNCLLTWLE